MLTYAAWGSVEVALDFPTGKAHSVKSVYLSRRCHICPGPSRAPRGEVRDISRIRCVSITIQRPHIRPFRPPSALGVRRSVGPLPCSSGEMPRITTLLAIRRARTNPSRSYSAACLTGSYYRRVPRRSSVLGDQEDWTGHSAWPSSTPPTTEWTRRCVTSVESSAT